MALTKLTNPRALWITFKLKVAGAVSRKLYDKLVERGVSVKDFGATGDGVTDDTEAIRKALLFSTHVHFPSPDVAYRVTDSIQVFGGQKLTGDSKSDGYSRDTDLAKKGIYGDMEVNGTPVFLLGDGVDPTKRLASFYDLYIYCHNGACIKSRYSTEYAFYSCTINSRFYHAIDTQQSYLCSWYNCKIGASGSVGNLGLEPSYAILAMDNSNGLLFSCCRITGGSGGGVADIGKSYTITFDTCVFETSLWGIRVAGNPNATWSGNVHAFAMYNCQFENCGQALDLGSTYSAKSVTVNNTFITHPQTGGMPFTEATIKIGRVIGLNISTLVVDLAPTQYLFNFSYSATAANAGSLAHLKNGTIKGVDYFRIGSGFGYSTSGFVNNDQLSRLAENYMELPEFTTGVLHEVTTQMIDNTVGTLPTYLQLIKTKPFGYQIEKVEIIEANGTINGRLVIGQTASQSENMDYTLDGTGFVDGYLDITDQVPNTYVRTTTHNRVRWIAGAGSGSLKVRITYKG